MTNSTVTYKQKTSAVRAAKKALESAPEGSTYAVNGSDEAGWTYKLVLLDAVEAHDPAVTMSEPDTISAPLDVASQGPVDDITEEVVVTGVVAEVGAPITERPFAYLPEGDELVGMLIEFAGKGEEAEELRKVAEDAGVPFSELRAMTLETAVEHLRVIIEQDRAAWDEDFGGKKPAREATVKGEKKITHKSEIESPVKFVWDTATRMFAENPNTKRKDVLKACEDAGVAYYTARTQYQQWLIAYKADLARKAANGEAAKAE